MTKRTEPKAERFRDLIRSRTGLAVPSLRAPDLAQAMDRAAKTAHHANTATLFDALSDDHGESWNALLSALNIGETHFFRDAEQIRMLQASILPHLIRLRTGRRKLRLWSAGCSSGEEPYTLAMMLRELIPDFHSWEVSILATDINSSSLARARRGVYRQWSLRGTSAAGLERWVHKRGDVYEVAPTIREMVTFERLNLAEPVYPSVKTANMDLILCRNVLLYFDRSAAQAVVSRLSRSLSDHGQLMVSRVDAGLGIFEGLRTEEPGSGIFTKAAEAPAAQAQPRRDQRTDRNPPTAARRREAMQRAARDRNRIRRSTGAVPPPGTGSTPAEAATGTTAPSQSPFDSAVAAWRSGSDERARGIVEEAAAGDPLNAHIHYFHGVILLARRDFGGALRAFRRATYADPGFALGYLGLGTALSRLGHDDRARAALEAAGRLAADLPPEALIIPDDGVTAADVLELIAGERALLDTRTGTA